ncbi:MAG TPA: WD40 repeat domain-containing protein [Myxococcales bacterium]|nr:WD40 repeat domain-containing protein [Myxococcales bacterium]
MGKVGKWTVAVALCGAACAKGVADPGGGNTGVVTPPDAGPVDAGPADAGPTDAGPTDAGPTDAGPADAGPTAGTITFGTPGPWPVANVEYGYADGILESPVVGVSTDEPVTTADGGVTQNLWVATNSALYLLRPGAKKFTRFDGHDGLHLPGFPAASCDDAQGTHKPCPNGDAAQPGISEIVGGGPNEVFVGYYGYHDWSRLDDGTWTDPWMHSGKLDRVRLGSDGKLQVVRMDMVSNNSPEFWHNKSVWKMVYDHGIKDVGNVVSHPHELYVGTDHGVDKITPDLWKEPDKGTWFLLPQNQQLWMSDHLHPQACFHHLCDGEKYTQMLGDFRGLAVDANGDLWVGGRWATGKIRYVADNRIWWLTPRPDKIEAMKPAFGDGSCPAFCPPQEGDPVNISAITVTKDGKVWFSSGTLYNDPADVPYGIASYDGHQFTHYDPVRDLGMSESHIRDMIALPDGRLVVAGLSGGLVFWDPATGKHTTVRAGQGIPDDGVMRIQLDMMVDPPALQVATRGGAAVLRVLP